MMKATNLWRTALAASAALAISGCEEGALETRSAAGEAQAVQAGQTVTRDVERPDVFSATETALWDGRPSLGGIWVAHPDVTDPERARITNTANGESVSGALFRRVRDNPGPRIQLSSDAAAALGILAGTPTEVSVVAVRVEEVEIAPPPPPPSDEPEADMDEAEGEAVAVAAAALATDAAGQGAAAAAPKKTGFWSRFRNSLRNEPAAESGEAAAAPEIADSAAPPSVDTQPLDTVAVATAAIEAAEAETIEPSGLKNPFIQVGVFRNAANADAAATSLRQGGIVPSVIAPEESGELWRIVVGPISSAADQTSLLARIRELGFADAFPSPT